MKLAYCYKMFSTDRNKLVTQLSLQLSDRLHTASTGLVCWSMLCTIHTFSLFQGSYLYLSCYLQGLSMVTSKAILDCDYYKTLIKAHLKVTSLLQAIVKLAVIDSLNLTRKRTINNYYPVLVDKSTVSVIKPREKRTCYNLHSKVIQLIARVL